MKRLLPLLATLSLTAAPAFALTGQEHHLWNEYKAGSQAQATAFTEAQSTNNYKKWCEILASRETLLIQMTRDGVQWSAADQKIGTSNKNNLDLCVKKGLIATNPHNAQAPTRLTQQQRLAQIQRGVSALAALGSTPYYSPSNNCQRSYGLTSEFGGGHREARGADYEWCMREIRAGRNPF